MLLVNVSLCCIGLQPTLPAADKKQPKAGNLGHITRIANKIVQIGQGKKSIQTHIQV